MYVFLFLAIILIFLIIIIPLKIKIKCKINTKDDLVEKIYYNIDIRIYLLGFIKVKRILLKKGRKVAKSNILYKVFSRFYIKIKDYLKFLSSKDMERLRKGGKVKKINLNIALNTGNMILNAYLITLVNSLISIYISKNLEKFDVNNLQYTTNTSKKAVDINIDSIINIKFVNTIIVLINYIKRIRKVEKENGRNTTTSNRKFDVNSYDISRKYGRC